VVTDSKVGWALRLRASAVEKRRAAEQKAAEEQRAAEQKAAEEQRAAEQKAAEEQRAAEEKLAEERRAAEQAKVRLAAEQKLAEEQRCAQDLRCTAEKALPIATVKCTSAVERLAKNNFEWIDKWHEQKFSHYRWKNNNTLIVTYVGDKIKYHNGFGAWFLSVYECDFDIKGERVVDARAQTGRLPE
jgi:hypothetical protein